MGTSKRVRFDPTPSDQFPNLENPKATSEISRYEIPDRGLAKYPTYTYKLGKPFAPEHRNVVAIVAIDRGRVTIAYDVVDPLANVAVE